MPHAHVIGFRDEHIADGAAELVFIELPAHLLGPMRAGVIDRARRDNLDNLMIHTLSLRPQSSCENQIVPIQPISTNINCGSVLKPWRLLRNRTLALHCILVLGVGNHYG